MSKAITSSQNSSNAMLAAVLSPEEKLMNWLNSKIEEAKKKGEEMFLSVPDAWWEQALHCCNNGHVNSMYLKSSERGSVCMDCGQPSHIFPTGVSQTDLKIALSANGS